MAKNSGNTKAPSRIRFVMVEAELGDGDIGQITQAISNALRGPTPATVVKRISQPQLNGNPANAEEHNEPDLFDAAEEIEVEVADVASAASKGPKKKRVASKPNMVQIDTESEPKLSTLVDGKSNHKRYLAIAAWLHDHRNTPVVTRDDIYSCYRLLGWPTDIPDFAQPLHELKHKQYFESPERGKFAINQLGLQKAKED